MLIVSGGTETVRFPTYKNGKSFEGRGQRAKVAWPYSPTFFTSATNLGSFRRVSNVGSTLSQTMDSLRSL
jgi:hypothetical protein